MSQPQPQPRVPQKEVVTFIQNRQYFHHLLEHNPGVLILKLGAKWCGPCKRIQPQLDVFYATSPDHVICCDIDVDESFDLYAYLKAKKMVNGIPAILCYVIGNTTFVPDDAVVGADPVQVDAFFRRVSARAARVAPPAAQFRR